MSSIDEYDKYLATDGGIKEDYESVSGYDFQQPAADSGITAAAAAAAEEEEEVIDDPLNRTGGHGSGSSSSSSIGDEVQEQEGVHEEEDNDEIGTFEVIISEPEKSSGKIGHHWVYTITWSTTLSTYAIRNERRVVKRRFSDFLWLRDRLEKEFLGVVVPPVPEKTMLGTVEKFFSSAVDTNALLQYRQRALTKFLARVTEHPQLQRSQTLQQFLEVVDDAEFNNLKAAKVDASQQPTSHSTLGKFFKKHHTKEPEWITQKRAFLQKLEESLRQMRQRLQDLVQKRRNLSTAISEFANAFRHLSLVEKSYQEGTLSRSLMETAHKADSNSTHLLTLANRETIQLIETISFYLGMIECIRKTMTQLDNMRLDRDDATLAVKTHKATLERLIRQQAKEERIKVAETAVFEAEDKEKASSETYDKALEQFQNEMKRFDTERRVDFSYMMSSFAQLQISSCVDIQQVWKSVEVFVDSESQTEGEDVSSLGSP